MRRKFSLLIGLFIGTVFSAGAYASSCQNAQLVRRSSLELIQSGVQFRALVNQITHNQILALDVTQLIRATRQLRQATAGSNTCLELRQKFQQVRLQFNELQPKVRRNLLRFHDFRLTQKWLQVAQDYRELSFKFPGRIFEPVQP